MSKDRGYLRTLSCSISLSSCRVRAEALARSLNSRLWSRHGLDATCRTDTCERLLTDSSPMANVVDKPPRTQDTAFGGSDLKEISHCWVNEMAVDEDELFDTPPCSSPPSPADEEIILNPPSPLPFCTKFLRDFNSSAEYRAGGYSRDKRSVLPDEAALRDKLQQYADGLLTASDDGAETFYDASDVDKRTECNDFVKKISSDLKTDCLEKSASPSQSVEVEAECLKLSGICENGEIEIDSTTLLETICQIPNDVSSSSSDVDATQVDLHENASFDDSVKYPKCRERMSNQYVSDIQEEEGRPRLFRSTSLKTGKTPPNTPGRKKIVRFADVLGLDLEAVRHIVCEDLPYVPSSAFRDLKLSPEEDCEQAPAPPSRTVSVPPSSWKSVPTASGSVLNSLFPLFRPPGTDPDFLDRLRREYVCLEAITVSVHSVHVVCRVLNIAYEKSVACRYTMDNWRTVEDVVAAYVPLSSDGESDRFSFSLFLPVQSRGIRDDVSFVIKYSVHDRDYWDNNHGQNYTLRYHSNGSLIVPNPEDHPPWLHHFF